MRTQDIVIGEVYRLRGPKNFGWVTIIRKLKPQELPNATRYVVYECGHMIHKKDKVGSCRYFRPCDIEKDEKEVIRVAAR